MIIDITGIILTPGNSGEDCLGNGKHADIKGERLECCCDECDYFLCCFGDGYPQTCLNCPVLECPRNCSVS